MCAKTGKLLSNKMFLALVVVPIVEVVTNRRYKLSLIKRYAENILGEDWTDQLEDLEYGREQTRQKQF